MDEKGEAMIYFDQSATSLHKPEGVAKAVMRGLSGLCGNPARGAHDAAMAALQELGRARRTAARFFGVSPLDVAFTSGATLALNMAIKGALTPDDRVLTTSYSHNAMLRPLYEMQGLGMGLEVATGDIVDVIHPGITALAINAMSNVTGETAPIEEIIQLCWERELLLILDVSQWAGTRAMPDVPHWPRSLLAFTGHKSLYGPQGTGGLVKQGDVSLKPFVTGGSGVHSFDHQHPGTYPEACEAGTPNMPGIMGLSAGISWLMETGQDVVSAKLSMLRERFVSGLKEIPGIVLYGSQENCGPVVSLNVTGLPSGMVSDRLNAKFGICTRPGAHCAPLMHEAMGTESQGTVRFSFSYFNQPEEIDLALAALKQIV